MTDLIRDIPLDKIAIDPDHNYREDMSTDDLEESMGAIGLLHPIVVARAEGDEADGERFVLNSGERRLRAAVKLGWASIQARIMEADAVSLELASIDENIVRRGLRGAALDRALARRKELYLLKFPETAQYVAGAHAAANPDQDRTRSFTEDTADKTGKSPRTIERSVRRAERLSPGTMQAYEQGRISQTQADILAGLPHQEQETILEHVVGKSVEETRSLVSGELERAGQDAAKATSPMQRLEELYMYGQKVVATLDALAKSGALDEELVVSVLNLQDTLNEEFTSFGTKARAALEAQADAGKEEAPDDAKEASTNSIFPEEPPF